MNLLILLIPSLVLAVCLWRSERRCDRLERNSIRAEERWAEERSGLLVRIQAPERAVMEDFEPSSLKQYASFGDDEDTWKALEEVNGGD